MPSANVLPALPPLALTSALLLQTRTPRSGEVKWLAQVKWIVYLNGSAQIRAGSGFKALGHCIMQQSIGLKESYVTFQQFIKYEIKTR